MRAHFKQTLDYTMLPESGRRIMDAVLDLVTDKRDVDPNTLMNILANMIAIVPLFVDDMEDDERIAVINRVASTLEELFVIHRQNLMDAQAEHDMAATQDKQIIINEQSNIIH